MKIMLACKCASNDGIQIESAAENSSKRKKKTFKEGGNRKNRYRFRKKIIAIIYFCVDAKQHFVPFRFYLWKLKTNHNMMMRMPLILNNFQWSINVCVFFFLNSFQCDYFIIMQTVASVVSQVDNNLLNDIYLMAI